MMATRIAAGLLLAACLHPAGAFARDPGAPPPGTKTDGSVALPAARDGVITPRTSPVDPNMPVVRPGVPTRMPVIRPAAPPDGRGRVEPR